jgi:Glutathione S-transferase, N-terminal domain
MVLYVCWGTFQTDKGHPCGDAYKALTDAGHGPEVVRTGGCFRTDPLFPRRRKIRRMTGNYKVPTLVLDDGTVIDGSASIIEWANAHPARAASRGQAS